MTAAVEQRFFESLTKNDDYVVVSSAKTVVRLKQDQRLGKVIEASKQPATTYHTSFQQNQHVPIKR